MINRLLNCQKQITVADDTNNIQIYYEEPIIDEKTRRSMRITSDNKLSPIGNGPVATYSTIEGGESASIPTNPSINFIGSIQNPQPITGQEPIPGSRLERFNIDLPVGPQNIGSLNVKINADGLKRASGLDETFKIFASVWTDPGPSLIDIVNGGEKIEFIGNTDDQQFNEYTNDYSPPLTSDQLNWVELTGDGEINELGELDGSDNSNYLRKTRVVEQKTPNSNHSTLSWIVAGEYDNSNGSIFSETLAMIDSGLVWDQTSNNVDIRSNVQCYPPSSGDPHYYNQWCGGSGGGGGNSFESGKGCVTPAEGGEGNVVNLSPCLENLDYADMNTTLNNGIVKTFVMFLAYGEDLDDARENFNYGCQTTIHILVRSDQCIKGWTGLQDITTALSRLLSEGEDIVRTEPIELMEGCRVLGCLDPITGKYQTKDSRPDFQNNPREYCEWLSMSAAQPANIGDIDDTNHIVSSITSGLEENKGRSSIDSNALRTNWNINTKMFRTTYAQGDPCIPMCDDQGNCQPNPDCFTTNRTRGQSIISQIKDEENISPEGIDGPLGNLYGRKWLEITDNNCVYDSYVDDCVERRCGVGNQGENCTVPCCKGTCVYPTRGGVANTASTNNEDGWPLIQTSNTRDDYMPIPYDLGVDQSSWCKNEIGCEFYEGRDDEVNNIDADDTNNILIYNSGNGGSLEDGSDICTQCAGPPNWLEFNNRSSGSVLDTIGDGGGGGGGASGRSTVTSSGVLPDDINFAPGADYTGPQCDMRCCGAVCDPLGGNAMDQCSVQPVDASLTRNYCQYFEEWNKCLEICQGNTSEECTDNRGCRWGVDPGNGTGSENLTACLPNLCRCENGIQSVGRNCAMHDQVGCVVDQCDWGYKSEKIPKVVPVCSQIERDLNGGECIEYEYFDCIETWWHKFGTWYIQSMDIENIGISFFGNDEGGPVRTIIFLCILSSSLIALSGFLQILGTMSNPKKLMAGAIPIAISFGMSLLIYFGPVLFYTVIWCGELAPGCDNDIPYGNAWTLLYKILLPVLIFFIVLIIIKTLISIVSN